MIRGYTLIALAVVLGLACVLGEKGLVSEKRPESKSVLVDIDPDADEALDNVDETEDTDDDHPAKPLSDPIFWNGRRRRRRYNTRRPYPTRRPYRRPYPTRRPYPNSKAPHHSKSLLSLKTNRYPVG